MSRQPQDQKLFFSFLSVVFLLELSLQTFWKDELGVYFQPFVYLIIVGAYFFLAIHYSTREGSGLMRSSPGEKWRRIADLATVVISSLLFYSVFTRLGGLINEIEIDPMNSDVMPAIQLYVKRVLAGEWAYAPMEFPGWTVIPNYLPMVWLPFMIPELLGIDYRWLPFGLFMIYTLFYWRKLWLKTTLHPVELILKGILPATILWLLIKYEPMIFAHTAEIMIAVFYLILCETVLSKRPWLAAIGISLCLLSRYSFGLWLPFYLFVYWFTLGTRLFVQTCIWIAVAVFIIYVFPFLFEDPFVYQKGMAYYMSSAEGEWIPHGWQQPGERPFHLARGFGFAVYVYDFINGDVPLKLKVIQILNLSSSLLMVSILLAAFWWLKDRITSRALYLILALKIYLMVFYSFIHVPYAYLFSVPLLLILPIALRVDLFSDKVLSGEKISEGSSLAGM